MGKSASSAHKSYKGTTNSQAPKAKDYGQRYTVEHLRPEKRLVRESGKLGCSKLGMYTKEFRKTHTFAQEIPEKNLKFHLKLIPNSEEI